MDPIAFLKERRYRVEEYKLLDQIGLDYWHTTILSRDGEPVSSGFGISKTDARKIAFSECLERSFYKTIATGSDEASTSWGINLIPTGCGFAAGFDQQNTAVRSIGEAVERWVASKWIDEHYQLREHDKESVTCKLDPVSKWLYSQFDSVRFFSKQVQILCGERVLEFTIGMTIAVKDAGVFQGSSAQFDCGLIWQHALVESFRHLLAFKNNSLSDKFPENRVSYFATHAEDAFQQIALATKGNWPHPIIVFQNSCYFEKENFYLARTIIGGWKSWHLGPLTRFLY